MKTPRNYVHASYGFSLDCPSNFLGPYHTTQCNMLSDMVKNAMIDALKEVPKPGEIGLAGTTDLPANLVFLADLIRSSK